MATFYVDPTSGSNSNDGSTPALAFLTIDYANGESTTGDTIQIVSGTHTVTTLTMDESRTYTGTLDANGQIDTILDFNGLMPSGASANFPEEFGAATFLLKDVKIINVNTTAGDIYRYPFGSNSGGSGWTITLRNVVFDNWDVGDAVGSFRGSIFSYRPTPDDMFLTFDKCIFSNIRIVSGATNGAIFATNTPRFANLTFTNCILSMTPSSGTQFNKLYTSDSNSSGSSLTIRNSIVYSTTGSIAIASAQTTNVNVDYADNIFFGTYTNPTLSTALTSDPKFISVANGNFNLRPDVSPAINAGVVL